MNVFCDWMNARLTNQSAVVILDQSLHIIIFKKGRFSFKRNEFSLKNSPFVQYQNKPTILTIELFNRGAHFVGFYFYKSNPLKQRHAHFSCGQHFTSFWTFLVLTRYVVNFHMTLTVIDFLVAKKEEKKIYRHEWTTFISRRNRDTEVYLMNSNVPN